MRKILLAVAALLALTGCLPFTPAPNPGPTVDIAATAAANMQTAVAQTLTAQPSITSFLILETTTPSLTAEATLSPTIPATIVFETSTVTTATFEVATSTNIAATTVPAGSASLTPTLGVLTYGTLPPAIVPYSDITLINRSKRQAYISLQVFTEKGGPTIIEYPVRGQVTVLAPTGHYLYVAWVGGREMVGEFRLKKDQDVTIVLYKDRVEIK
jgi:hypothetical protein